MTNQELREAILLALEKQDIVSIFSLLPGLPVEQRIEVFMEPVETANENGYTLAGAVLNRFNSLESKIAAMETIFQGLSFKERMKLLTTEIPSKSGEKQKPNILSSLLVSLLMSNQTYDHYKIRFKGDKLLTFLLGGATPEEKYTLLIAPLSPTTPLIRCETFFSALIDMNIMKVEEGRILLPFLMEGLSFSQRLILLTTEIPVGVEGVNDCALIRLIKEPNQKLTDSFFKGSTLEDHMALLSVDPPLIVPAIKNKNAAMVSLFLRPMNAELLFEYLNMPIESVEETPFVLAIKANDAALMNALTGGLTPELKVQLMTQAIETEEYEFKRPLEAAVSLRANNLVDMIMKAIPADKRYACVSAMFPEPNDSNSLITQIFASPSGDDIHMTLLRNLTPDEQFKVLSVPLNLLMGRDWTAVQTAINANDVKLLAAYLKPLSFQQRSALLLSEIDSMYHISGLSRLLLRDNGRMHEAVFKDLTWAELMKLVNHREGGDYNSGRTSFQMAMDKTTNLTDVKYILSRFPPEEAFIFYISNLIDLDASIFDRTDVNIFNSPDPHLDLLDELASKLSPERFDTLMKLRVPLNSTAEGQSSTLSLETFLAITNLFDREEFAGYTRRHVVNLTALARSGFELKFPIRLSGKSYDRLGFDLALVCGSIRAQDFTLEERVAIFTTPARILCETSNSSIRNRIRIQRDILSLINTWTAGFTLEQCRIALTPAGLAANAENPLMVAAIEFHGLDRELVRHLQRIGLVIPPRFQNLNVGGRNPNRIQYAQSIHNSPVHKTVGDSLVALNRVEPLSQKRIDRAIQAWLRFAARLPKEGDNTDERVVARRALLRITTPQFLAYAETNSGLSIAHILAYCWIHLKEIKDRDKRASLMAIMLIQLHTIQRDYNADDAGADATICVGGTINQLVIALSKIYPRQVWVVFQDKYTLGLTALNNIPALIKAAFDEAADRIAFAHLFDGMPPDKVLPDAVMDLIEPKLISLLKESLINRDFDPPRSCMDNDEAALRLINDALRVIRTGKTQFTAEMRQPLGSIEKQIAQDLAVALRSKSAEQIRLNQEKFDQLLKEYGPELDKFAQEYEAETPIPSSAGKPQLAHYNLMTQVPIVLTPEETTEFEIIKRFDQYATKEIPKDLPQVFKDLANNTKMMDEMIRLLYIGGLDWKPKASKIHLVDLFTNFNVTQDKWAPAFEKLGCPPMTDDESEEAYLYEHSPVLYGVLFHLHAKDLKEMTKLKRFDL